MFEIKTINQSINQSINFKLQSIFLTRQVLINRPNKLINRYVEYMNIHKYTHPGRFGNIGRETIDQILLH